MSDTPQGPGWWIASDGKWYPPQEQPSIDPPTDTAATPAAPSDRGGPPWYRRKRWWIVAALVLVVVLVAIFGGDDDDGDEGSGPDDDAVAAEATTTTVTTTTSAPTTTAAPTTTTSSATTTTSTTTTTTTSTTTTTTTTTQPPTTTAPPPPGFGGGIQLVGEDIEPGRYIVSGFGQCYWERLSGLSGEFDDIITNDNGDGQAIVAIAPDDIAFDSTGCGRWERYEPPASPSDTFGDGDWAVGEQIAPGRYRATAESHCYWERASGFGHDFGEIITNANVDAGNTAIVELAASDRRFTSRGCGTWTPG